MFLPLALKQDIQRLIFPVIVNFDNLLLNRLYLAVRQKVISKEKLIDAFMNIGVDIKHISFRQPLLVVLVHVLRQLKDNMWIVEANIAFDKMDAIKKEEGGGIEYFNKKLPLKNGKK